MKYKRSDWGFNTGVKILDRVLDWVWLFIHKPK